MAAVPVSGRMRGSASLPCEHVTLPARMVVYGEVRRKTRRDVLIMISVVLSVLTCHVYVKIIYF